MAEMKQCWFPGGCATRTADTTGLCHDHRRFSGTLLNDGGRQITLPRLANTVALARSNSELYQQAQAAGAAAMNSRPRAYSHPEGIRLTHQYDDRLYWKGADRSLPYSDSEVSIRSLGGGEVLITPVDEAHAAPALLHANAALERQLHHDYADHYHLYSGGAEEYDDVPEAIAQLNLGERFAGVRLTVRTAINPAQGDTEVFEIRERRAYGPAMTGTITAAPGRDADTHELRTVYGAREVELHSGAPEDAGTRYQGLVMALLQVRNSIGKHALTHPDTGKVYLPAGWESR